MRSRRALHRRDPGAVASARSADSRWRNRSGFLQGRPAIIAFLRAKWARERECRPIKDLHAFDGAMIAVRFRYEWHDAVGRWWQSYDKENWQFDGEELMTRREASVDDVEIVAADRRFHWPAPGVPPARAPRPARARTPPASRPVAIRTMRSAHFKARAPSRPARPAAIRACAPPRPRLRGLCAWRPRSAPPRPCRHACRSCRSAWG